MDKSLIAFSSIQICSTPKEVWDVMINPEKIKKYLFGTYVQTDWQEGSAIIFHGDYQGKKYIDKGNVLEHQRNKFLKYNYWTGMSGLADKPENYSIVTYKIEPISKEIMEFTWYQQGFASEDRKCHTEKGLQSILKQIKQLAEE